MSNAMMTTSTTAEPTMSSQEIAELTGKNHADVMRDIRNMLDALGVVHSSFAGYYKASNGKTNPCFNLDRFRTELLVTGYDVKRRAAVITRWFELEKQVAQPQVPQSFAQALRLAADTQEQLEQAEEKNATYEKVIGTNCHSLSKFARTLPGLNSNKLKSDLEFFEYLYKRGGGYKRYSRFDHLFEEKHHEEYGSVEIYPTEKGKQRILELYERGALTMKKAWQK